MALEFDARFDKLNKAIDSLIVRMERIEGAFASFERRSQGFDKLFANSQNFKKFMEVVKDVDPRTGKNLDTVSRSLVRLADASNNLSGERLQKAVESLTQLFRAIVAISKVASSGQSLNQIAKILDRVSLSFVRFADLANKLDTRKVLKLSLFFGALSTIFRLLAAAVNRLPGGDAVSELSKVFDRLGRGLRSIANVADKVSLKTMLNVAKVLGAITLALRIAARFSGNPQRLAAFGNALVGIGSLFAHLRQVDPGDPKRASNLRKIVKDVALAVNELGAVRVDVRKLTAIGSVLGGLGSKLAGIGSQGAEGLQRGFFNNLVIGFQRRIGEQLFNVMTLGFGKAFKTILTGARTFASQLFSTFTDLGNRVQAFGDRLISTATNIVNRFGFGAFMESQAVKTAASFDQISKQLQVFGHLTDEELARAQDFANQIGIDYPQSANEALDAILKLTKAGRDLNEVEFILPSAADLAALSDTGDLDRVTRGLIGVAGAFEEFTDGIEGSFTNIARASDLISSAADVSTASVESLMDGLENVGPAANLAGLNLEETLAILADFEDAGKRGAEGGTALRSVLTALHSNRARDELRKLDVALFNEDGTIRDLNAVIQDLNATYDRLGFTEAERLVSINNIGDSYSRVGLSILLANNGFSETAEAMNEIAPASERAQQIMDSFNGDVEQLRGSLETLQTHALVPLINRAFRPLVRVARQVVDFFNRLPDPVLESIVTTLALASALVTLTGAALITLGVVLKLGGAMVSLVGTIGSLILNLPAVIASIAAVGAGFAAFLAIAIPLGIALGGLAITITRFVRAIEQNVDGAGEAFERFKETVRESLGIIGGIVNTVVESVRLLFRGLSGARPTSFRAFIDSINVRLQGFNKTLQQASQFLSVFRQFLAGTGTRSAFAAYRTALEELADLPLVQTLFGEDVTAGRLDRFFRQVTQTFESLISSIRNIGGGLVDAIFGSGDVARLRKGVQQLLVTIVGIMQSFTGIDFARTILRLDTGDFTGAAREFVSSLFDSLKNAVLQNEETLTNIAASIFDFLFNPFSTGARIADILGLESVAEPLRAISDQVLTFFRNLLGTLFDLARGQSLSDALLGNFGTGIEPVIRVIAFIQQAIATFVTFIQGTVIPIIQQFVLELQRIWVEVQPTLQALFDYAVNVLFPAIVQIVQTVVIPAIVTLVDTLRGMWEQARPGLEQLRDQFINGILPAIQDLIVNRIIPTLQFFATTLLELWDHVRPGLEALAQWFFTELLPAMVGIVQNVVIPTIGRLVGILAGIWDQVRPALARLIDFFVLTLLPIVRGVVNALIPIIGVLINAIGGIVEFLSPVVGFILSTFVDAFGGIGRILLEIGRVIVTAINGILTAVRTGATPLGLLFNNIGRIIAGAFEIGISAINIFINVVSSIWNLVRFGLDSLVNGLGIIFRFIDQNILRPVLNVIGGIINAIRNLFPQARGPALDFGQLLNDIFTGIIDLIVGIVNGIENITRSIREATDELFALTDAGAAERQRIRRLLSGEDAGTGQGAFFDIADILRSSADPAAIEAALRDNADAVFQAFQQVFHSAEFQARLADGFIDPAVFDVLAKSDNLDRFISSLSTGSTQILNVLNGLATQAPDILDDINLDELIPEILSDTVASDSAEKIELLAHTLNALAQAGKITEEQAAEGINSLLARVDELGPGLDTGRTSFDRFRGGIAGLLDDLHVAQDVLDQFGISLDDLPDEFQLDFVIGNPDIPEERRGGRERDRAPGELPPEVQDFQITVDDALEGVDQFGDAINDAADELAEFQIDEQRRREEDIREEQKKAADIQEIRDEAEREQREKIRDFNIETQRDAQDHQRRLSEIINNGTDAFEDAIGARDASAAQAAEENLKKELRDENDKFAIDQERRKQDFELELQDAAAKTQLRIQQAQQELRDLQAKNARERSERLADFQRKHNDLVAANNAGQQAQAQHLGQLQNRQVQHNANEATLNSHFLNNVVQTLSNARNNFFNFIKGIGGAIASLGQSNGPLSFLQSVFNSVGSFVQGFAQQIQGFLGNLFGGSSATSGISNFISGIFGGNRAFGGSVDPDKLFRISDRSDGRPELLRSGSDTFLLPGRSGMVTPPSVLPNRAAAAGIGGMSVLVDMSGMVIQGGNADPLAIAEMVEMRVIAGVENSLKRVSEGRRRL